MLSIQAKLMDTVTKRCIGVVCVNGHTSVSLSLEKAKELGIEDIEIIEYLGVSEIDVVVHPRKPNYYALLSSASGYLEDFKDSPYEVLGDICSVIDKSEVIWGYIFRVIDFIELNNPVAVQRSLQDFEC